MSNAIMLVELGNFWELQVEIEVVDYSPGWAGGRWEPSEPEWIAFGKILAVEALEEAGIKEGQEIHPAYLTESLEALERRFLREQAMEAEYARADYYADAYDHYHDR
jgi:hypothetical protein